MSMGTAETRLRALLERLDELASLDTADVEQIANAAGELGPLCVQISAELAGDGARPEIGALIREAASKISSCCEGMRTRQAEIQRELQAVRSARQASVEEVPEPAYFSQRA